MPRLKKTAPAATPVPAPLTLPAGDAAKDFNLPPSGSAVPPPQVHQPGENYPTPPAAAAPVSAGVTSGKKRAASAAAAVAASGTGRGKKPNRGENKYALWIGSSNMPRGFFKTKDEIIEYLKGYDAPLVNVTIGTLKPVKPVVTIPEL